MASLSLSQRRAKFLKGVSCMCVCVCMRLIGETQNAAGVKAVTFVTLHDTDRSSLQVCAMCVCVYVYLVIVLCVLSAW